MLPIHKPSGEHINQLPNVWFWFVFELQATESAG